MDDMHPTLFFGFHLSGGKEALHQLWMSENGLQEWRPVPTINMEPRQPALVIEGEAMDDDE